MWIRVTVILLALTSVSACSTHSGGSGASAPASDVAAGGGTTSDEAARDAPSRPTSGATSTTKTYAAPTDAWAAIRSGALLVDVRTQAEYEQGHLEGALLIPHDQIPSRVTELGEDKSRAIVLYCRSGNRSSQAKQALEELGYTNVMNAGGYERLKQAQ